MKEYVCVDIGGTAMKYGVVQEEGKFLETGEIPTEAWKGGSGILENWSGSAKRPEGGIICRESAFPPPAWWTAKKGKLLFQALRYRIMREPA